jgi:hypothetical protein
MAFLGQSIRAEDLPQSSGGDFAPIPAGEYTVSIAAADLTPTKDGTGQYIKLKLNVIAPTHQGRVLFSNLNIRNQSAKAEEIGRQQLGAVMRAIGLATIEDTDQLIGGTLIAKVDIRTSEQYGAQNEVKAYKPLSGAAPAKPQQAAAQPQQAAAPAKRPW